MNKNINVSQMHKVTLRNDFHNSQINVLGSVAAAIARFRDIDCNSSKSDRAWANKIRRGLCGAGDCCCGVIRGPQGD